MDSLTAPQAGLDALLSPAGRALVEALTPYEPDRALGLVEAARRDPTWADRPEVVSAAATQARLRTRAAARFPGVPRWWTPAGLEQATRPAVATRHAERFGDAGVSDVVDLGCGAGSDALAMAAAGLRVVAVDRDPDALWALSATAGDRALPLQVLAGDVTSAATWAALAERGWPDRAAGSGQHPHGCFVDPARRTGTGARALAPEAWSPPWSWVRDLARRFPATGAKIAPGIDHAALPADAQVEWTSVGGDLVEAAAWWGPLRRGPAARIATALADPVPGGPEPTCDSAEADPETLDDHDGIPRAEVGPVGAWIVEPDPAVIRSGLVSVLAARLDGRLLDPRIAYITSDVPPRATRLGTPYEVLEEVPFARRAMRTWLRTRGYGDVVVKKRGLNLVPEQLRAALRLGGAGATATLLLTRTDTRPLALLVRRA